MISRRKIISRSLDNLDSIGPNDDEEDMWYDKDKLCKDHIDEVLSKWEQIDDEIWAKIVVFEKNRRVAKAYARSSVISINGSKHGFDGVRIGLNGFHNPMRDPQTKDVKKAIGEGFKLKMDETGNILIKRYGKSNVYVHSTSKLSNEETVIGADILQLPQQAINIGTSAKLFDMRKFTTNINREFSRTAPECNRLERQCLSAISVVKSSNNLIHSPLWILVINIVAIDMLKSRMTTIGRNIDNGLRISPTTSGSEDPYSTIESQAELILAEDAKMNAKLQEYSTYDDHPFVPKPDYEIYNQTISPIMSPKNKVVQRKKQDDPYYCGLLARIPNFIKSNKSSNSSKKKESKAARKISAQHLHLPSHPVPIGAFHQHPPASYYPFKLHPQHHRISQSQMSLWDARSLISGIE